MGNYDRKLTGKLYDKGGIVYNVMHPDFGAVNDGTSHPLSAFYGTLASAQAKYPHATALANEIDWAAMQLAVNSLPTGGGRAFLPVGGGYKFHSAASLALRDNVTLEGEKMGRRYNGTSDWQGSFIDATATTSGTVRVIAANAGNLNNIGIERLGIRIGTVSSDAAAFSGVQGIAIQSFVNRCVLRDVTIEGGQNGVSIKDSTEIRLEGVHCVNIRNRGLDISGNSTSNVLVLGGLYSNCGQSAQTDNGNIVIGTSATTPTAITVICPLVDEGGHASINLLKADGVTLMVDRLFHTKINANGTGAGYGIKLGDGTNNPTRVTIIGTRVEPFSGDRIPTNTILINGSGHRLVGVSTNANTGGDILDNATDTVYAGVNGTFKAGALRHIGRTATAAAPTTTELATDKDWSIHKDTSGGSVYLAYNDAGTIKKVALT
jgi:hypothetical protein